MLFPCTPSANQRLGCIFEVLYPTAPCGDSGCTGLGDVFFSCHVNRVLAISPLCGLSCVYCEVSLDHSVLCGVVGSVRLLSVLLVGDP